MVNITQSFLILHFSINCMLPLVTLGFPWLSLSNLGFTQLNLVDVSVSSERLCNPQFNSVKLGLFLLIPV